MFKKLRNKLILINVGITTAILVTVFSTIYIIYTNSANNRPPMPNDNFTFYSDDVENFIELTIRNEKKTAANELLVMLIVSGVVIEIAVAVVSYYLAEEAIKPVRNAYHSQKVFIANASHEIKTPLAAISANLEAADLHNNKWITNIEHETAKLTTLNNELLTLARTDLATTTSVAETNLKAIVQKELKSLEPRLAKTKIKLTTDLSDVTAKINSADFIQLFNILLDNAIKYSDRTITITLTEHTLIVSNDGTTIKAKDLPHIFDRFYQVDKSSDGVGLGLSIAKSLANRNHWQLVATSHDKKTTFTLTI